MKRSALARKTPLRASRSALKRIPMRPGKSKTKHAFRERSPAYMLWVKSQPCFVAQLVHAEHFMGRPIAFATPCNGPIEADHAGVRTDSAQGDGTRAYDATCIPLCRGHHAERHAFTGTFKTYAQGNMRAFLAAAIFTTQARARAKGVEIPSC